VRSNKREILPRDYGFFTKDRLFFWTSLSVRERQWTIHIHRKEKKKVRLVIESNLKINLFRSVAFVYSRVHFHNEYFRSLSTLCQLCPSSLSLFSFTRISYTRPTLQVVSRSARTEDVSQRIFPRYRVSLPLLFPHFSFSC